MTDVRVLVYSPAEAEPPDRLKTSANDDIAGNSSHLFIFSFRPLFMESTGMCTMCGKPSKKLYPCKTCGRIACGQCIQLDVCSSCMTGRKTEKNIQ